MNKELKPCPTSKEELVGFLTEHFGLYSRDEIIEMVENNILDARPSVSNEEIEKLVEKIAYEQYAEEQIDDLVAKMGIVREWLRSRSVNANLVEALNKSDRDFIKWQSEINGKLVEALNMAVTQARMKYEDEKAEVDFHNNNCPGVGDSIDYKIYEPLPLWVEKAESVLKSVESLQGEGEDSPDLIDCVMCPNCQDTMGFSNGHNTDPRLCDEPHLHCKNCGNRIYFDEEKILSTPTKEEQPKGGEE